MARGAIGGNGVLIGILASGDCAAGRDRAAALCDGAAHGRARYALNPRIQLIQQRTFPSRCALLLPVLGGTATDLEEAASSTALRTFAFCSRSWRQQRRQALRRRASDFRPVLEQYLFSVYLADNHAMTMPPFLAAQMSVREQQAGSDAEEWARLSAAIILMTAPSSHALDSRNAS